MEETTTKTELETEKPSYIMEEVETKPSRKYRKGSKFDPILDSFKASTSKMVTVELTGKDSNYLRTQLKKRIDITECSKKLKVSVVNNKVYLEKLDGSTQEEKAKKKRRESETPKS